MTERQLKIEATKREYKRVFEDMILPARDIRIDGWVRKAWNGLGNFGWDKWVRIN